MTGESNTGGDAAVSSANGRLVNEIATCVGSLGVEVADIAAQLEELTTRVTGQAAQFEELHHSTEAMVTGNRDVDWAAREAQQATTGGEIAESRKLLGTADQGASGVIRFGAEGDHLGVRVPREHRVLPALHDPLKRADPRIIFCVAWIRGIDLPTHNPQYRQPQSGDPVWNAAHCRNRGVFKDRAVQKVSRSTMPFLLQTHRRDRGGGQFVLMKDLLAPIGVNGRHGGAFRVGYLQQ